MVNGFDASGNFILSECPAGSSGCGTVTLGGGTAYYPGMVQWSSVNQSWVVGDQLCANTRTSCLYWFTVSDPRERSRARRPSTTTTAVRCATWSRPSLRRTDRDISQAATSTLVFIILAASIGGRAQPEAFRPTLTRGVVGSPNQQAPRSAQSNPHRDRCRGREAARLTEHPHFLKISFTVSSRAPRPLMEDVRGAAGIVVAPTELAEPVRGGDCAILEEVTTGGVPARPSPDPSAASGARAIRRPGVVARASFCSAIAPVTGGRTSKR